MDSDEIEVIEIGSSDSSDNEMDSINRDASEPDKVNDNVKVAEISSNVKMFSKAEIGEKLTAAKRKRESALSKMLTWLDSVAKNPANLKSYGIDHCWKQVLLTRDAMFHRKPLDSTPELFPSQEIYSKTVIGVGRAHIGVYWVQTLGSKACASYVQTSSCSATLWHRRMDHPPAIVLSSISSIDFSNTSFDSLLS